MTKVVISGRPNPARAGAILLLGLGSAACTSVLELDEYKPIERKLCQCTEDPDQFPASECEVWVRHALEAGGDETASFLAHFEANDCSNKCSEACFKHELLCDENVCTVSATCCGTAECCASSDDVSKNESGAVLGTCCEECFTCGALLASEDPFAAPCPGSAIAAADLKQCICSHMDVIEENCATACAQRCDPGGSINDGCAGCVNGELADQGTPTCALQEGKCRDDGD